ncbi:unnamed protein product [Coccothraustes coccothraustes]
MQALREAEDSNLELSGDKRPSRAAFGRSRALESTGTGTILSARRSRFFASGSRRARPLLRRRTKAHNSGIFSAALKPSKDSTFPEPPFGEHRHNVQCAKKLLLRLREPESAAAAET